VKTEGEVESAYAQLQRIGRAYGAAIAKLKHGPRSLDEFKPFLRAEPDGEQIIAAIGRNDLIVIWDLDFKDLTPVTPKEGKPRVPILAYQAKATEGVRLVLMRTTQVQEMSDAELREAYFPKGHKPRL
jgi:hypothetical protein